MNFSESVRTEFLAKAATFLDESVTKGTLVVPRDEEERYFCILGIMNSFMASEIADLRNNIDLVRDFGVAALKT